MMRSTDLENAFDKIQNTFMIKSISKLGIEVRLSKSVKNIYKNLTHRTLLNAEKLEAFPLRTESPLYNIIFTGSPR